jgi:predicted transcriptional regulator
VKQRVSVKEAAKLLNISEAAIRQRIQRDSIAHERDEEANRIYVILDEVEDLDGSLNGGETEIEHGYARELIDTLREQLDAERESNRENRRIIAALTSRIPQLEAPTETPQDPERATEGASGTEAPEPENQSSRPGWFRRFFGFD